MNNTPRKCPDCGAAPDASCHPLCGEVMDYMSNAATSAEQREYAKTLKTYRLANETEALRAENAKLKAEVARLRKASGHEAPKGSSRRARG